MLAKSPLAVFLSVFERNDSDPPCPHRTASFSTQKNNPNLLPRSFAKGFATDTTMGKGLGLIYEQQIGPMIIARRHDTPLTIQGQPNYVKWLMKANYGSPEKGYIFPAGARDVTVTTPFAAFLERYGQNNICHSICGSYRDPIEYSYCRLVESGVLIWILDMGTVDDSCCGKCDIDMLIMTFVHTFDGADRIRDFLTGELYNMNAVMGRQNILSLEIWKAFVLHGAYGFCCRRAENFYRATRNMNIWMYCNPVYYTHKWGQEEGVIEFVEAMNDLFMSNVKESQMAGEDENQASVDEIVRLMIGTRLVDFLLCFCV
ncbi:hypothetical protein TWF481_010316 [Arthrobotrys musiformis]|uniref:Uncharacterized protein n=1 Tax=Arthrobotrys musiformis TaxID=47236 RepID=A0AAV9W0M4_9PEZI